MCGNTRCVGTVLLSRKELLFQVDWKLKQASAILMVWCVTAAAHQKDKGVQARKPQ